MVSTVTCFDCSAQFSQAAFQRHLLQTNHTTGCIPCNKRFYSQKSLRQHIRDSAAHVGSTKKRSKKAVKKRALENKCPHCPRKFSTIAALNQHSAALHNRFRCLFNCKKTFKSPSAVAMHIESGIHKITRHQVTAAVHNLKIIPTISADRRLESPVVIPAAIVTYSATVHAFNGCAYECHICHCTFLTLGRLDAHLNSPVHDADEFKCPKCKLGFKLVSGLTQHIESSSCGLAKFKEVQTQFEGLTDQFSLALKF